MKRIENVTIVGVGLIVGSFALALKQAGFSGKITGCDSSAVLHTADAFGALDLSEEDIVAAVQNADLVVLGAPVRTNLALLATIAPHIPSDSLITDVGSTKTEIAGRAKDLFGSDALRKFLPGHPIAGREVSGVEHGDAALFRGAPWALTPQGGPTPEKHDRVLAFTSHLPQLISTALATTVQSELGGRPELRDLSGRALREMIRLAKSDPQLWSEISTSNSDNIREALSLMERNLAALREGLGTQRFQRLFQEGSVLDPDAEPSAADDADPPHFG